MDIGGQQAAGPGVMDTAALSDLRARLIAWESTALGDPLAAHHQGRLGRYLAQLRSLAEGEGPDLGRAVTMVALALGPRGDALPGAGDLGPLVQAALELGADVVDLGIAWGCGWQRVAVPEHRWHARWVAAVLSLSSMVAGSINQTVRWLAGSVADFLDVQQRAGAPELRERLQGFSDEIAMELAMGACRCGHVSRTGPAAIGVCSRPDHRLASWRPDVCRLQAFVATAVRGSARRPPPAGAFAFGMLARLLQEERLLRVDVAEFRVCHECNEGLIRLAAQRRRPIELSSVEHGLYDISRCPTPGCGARPHPSRAYHVGRKNWLLVPAEWGGQYHPTRRYRCGDCGNLFKPWLDRCPICGSQVRQRGRLTTVWVRLARRGPTGPNQGTGGRRTLIA
jgi:hypothetical protein